MFSVNWLVVLLFVVAFVLIRLGLQGTYSQAWGALTAIPLTPGQAQAQTSSAQAGQTSASPFRVPTQTFQRIG